MSLTNVTVIPISIYWQNTLSVLRNYTMYAIKKYESYLTLLWRPVANDVVTVDWGGGLQEGEQSNRPITYEALRKKDYSPPYTPCFRHPLRRVRSLPIHLLGRCATRLYLPRTGWRRPNNQERLRTFSSLPDQRKTDGCLLSVSEI